MSIVEKDYTGLRIVVVILNIFCYLGYIFVFFMYWFFKELRLFSFELVVWLCISSSFYSFSGFLWPDTKFSESGEYSFTCIMQSIVITVFENSTLIITGIIGYTAYINLINSKHLEKNRKKYRYIFLSLTVLIPLIPGLLIYFFGLYGPSGFSCWLDIQSNNSEKLDLIKKFDLIYHTFMWILIIINAYFILKLIIRMRTLVNDENRAFIERATSRLKWYPIVLVICFLPPTLWKLFNSVYSEENTFLLWVQSIIDSSQGLFFVIVYSFNPEVKQAAQQLFNKIFRQGQLSPTSNCQDSSICSEYSKKGDSSNIDLISYINTKSEDML